MPFLRLKVQESASGMHPQARPQAPCPEDANSVMLSIVERAAPKQIAAGSS
jgi:hypothetical protein